MRQTSTVMHMQYPIVAHAYAHDSHAKHILILGVTFVIDHKSANPLGQQHKLLYNTPHIHFSVTIFEVYPCFFQVKIRASNVS